MSAAAPEADPVGRVTELRALVEHHNEHYHVLDAPEIVASEMLPMLPRTIA